MLGWTGCNPSGREGTRRAGCWRTHCYWLLQLMRQPARATTDRTWRRAYVERQLGTARRALAFGSIALARAALRVLSGEDFAEAQEASSLLGILRGRAVEGRDVTAAVRRLCALTPFAPDRTQGTVPPGVPALPRPRRIFDFERKPDSLPVDLDRLRQAARLARETPAPSDPDGELRRMEVEAQQAVMRHAMRTGRIDLVRHAGRTLRVRDFAADALVVEGLLGVIRDARSADDELLDAAAQLAALGPAPAG